MKKTVTLLALLAASLSLTAKSTTHNVRYALPRTVISVKVDVKEQRILAGPCAEYAEDLLGISVPEHDTTIYSISGITLSTDSEPEYGRVISCNAKDDVLLQQLSEQGLLMLGALPVKAQNKTVNFPVRKYTHRAQKGLIEAKAAADQIESYRQDIYNITIGNTDAAYQGEALGSALAELHSREAELVKLFTSEEENYEYSSEFTFTPESDVTDTVCMNAFRFSPKHGLQPEYSNKGDLYTIEICPDPYFSIQAETPNEKEVALTYRLPVLCTIYVLCKGNVVCSLRAPVYQLGINEVLILQK